MQLNKYALDNLKFNDFWVWLDSFVKVNFKLGLWDGKRILPSILAFKIVKYEFV